MAFGKKEKNKDVSIGTNVRDPNFKDPQLANNHSFFVNGIDVTDVRIKKVKADLSDDEMRSAIEKVS